MPYTIRSQEIMEVALASEGAADEINQILINNWWFSLGTGPPSAGSWLQGQVIFNSAPVAAGIPAWSCVVSGTPGTWKAWSVLAT